MDTSSTGNGQQRTRITSAEELSRLLQEALSDPNSNMEMHKREIVQELHRIGLCCNHQTDLGDCRTRPKYTSQRRRAVLQSRRPIELKLPQKLARQKAEADSERYLAESPVAMSQLLRNDGPMLYNELEFKGNDKASSMATNMLRSLNQQPHRKFDPLIDRDLLLGLFEEYHELFAEPEVNKIGFSNQNTASAEQRARRQALSKELSKIFPRGHKRIGHFRVLILPKSALARSGSPVEWSITMTKLELVAFEVYAAEIDRDPSMFLGVQSQEYPPTGKDALARSGAIEGHSERAKQCEDYSCRSDHSSSYSTNIEAASVARIDEIFDALSGLFEHVQTASTWRVCGLSYSHPATNNASHIVGRTKQAMPAALVLYTRSIQLTNFSTTPMPKALSQSTLLPFWRNEGSFVDFCGPRGKTSVFDLRIDHGRERSRVGGILKYVIRASVLTRS